MNLVLIAASDSFVDPTRETQRISVSANSEATNNTTQSRCVHRDANNTKAKNAHFTPLPQYGLAIGRAVTGESLSIKDASTSTATQTDLQHCYAYELEGEHGS